MIDDPISEVAVTASWLALLRGDKRGGKSLKNWVLKGEDRFARLAAGALAISGEAGVKLSKWLMRKSRDPYIQMTLAIGLIGQRESVDAACKILAT